MSKGSCIAIGITALACCIGFVYVGISLGPQCPYGATPFNVIAAFCGILSLACLVKSSRALTLRLLGAAVCGAYVWGVYLFVTAQGHVAIADVIKVILGFAVFGLPAAYVAITGTYPKWGEHSKVFRRNATADRDPHYPEND
jgi:hypothetical protein